MAAGFSRRVRGEALRALLSDDEIELLLDYLSDFPPELDDPYPAAMEAVNMIEVAADAPDAQYMTVTDESARAITWALEQATQDGRELPDGLQQLLHLASA